MKKLIFIIGLVGVLLSPTIYAYVSAKKVGEARPIYCPQEITCSASSSSSCSFNGDTKYFGKISADLGGGGTYSFGSVIASYHSNSTSGNCKYVTSGHQCPYTKKNGCWLQLEIKPEANLEAYNKKSSAWVFGGQGATCAASSSSSCPLADRFGFVIHNVNISGGVLASINGSNISSLISSSVYSSIIYDDALVGCSSEKQCIIDLLSAKHVKYGSIKVDMDTMKILQVNSLYPDKIQINKLDSFNTVEINYQSPS